MKLWPIKVDILEKLPPAEEQVRRIQRAGGLAVTDSLGSVDYRWTLEPANQTDTWWTVEVQRKTIADLIHSTSSGALTRFIEQTGGMEPGENRIRVLLLEGDQFTPNSFGREWAVESIDNLLYDLQQLGIVVIRSESDHTTARRLVSFWKHTASEENLSVLQPHSRRAEGNYLDPDVRVAVEFLMGLPGWGEKRARAVLKKIPRPGDVIAMLWDHETAELQRVKGMGPGIVHNVQEFLNQKVEA